MRMKTISLAAAFTFAATAVASAGCSWGSAHDAMAYTPVDTKKAVERTEKPAGTAGSDHRQTPGSCRGFCFAAASGFADLGGGMSSTRVDVDICQFQLTYWA